MADLTLEGTAYEGVGYPSATAELKPNTESTNAPEANAVEKPQQEEAPVVEHKVEEYEGPTEEEFNKFNFGDKVVKTTDVSKPEAEVKKAEVVTAPEIKYEFKMPDNVDLDCEIMDKFKDVAKKHKLSNDDAQVYVDLVGQMINNEILSHKQNIATRLKEWQTELKNDPEVGGKNFSDTHKFANLAIEKFGGNEFRKFLDLTGVGNNKVIAKFLMNVGKTLSEDDSFITGAKAVNYSKEKPSRDAFGNPMLYFPSMDK